MFFPQTKLRLRDTSESEDFSEIVEKVASMIATKAFGPPSEKILFSFDIDFDIAIDY